MTVGFAGRRAGPGRRRLALDALAALAHAGRAGWRRLGLCGSLAALRNGRRPTGHEAQEIRWQ